MILTKTNTDSRIDGFCAELAGPDVDCAGDCFGNAEIDCNGICDGGDVVDQCGICGGDGTWCLSASITLGNATDTTLEVLYDSPLDMGGFQFDVSGVNVLSGAGGAAGAAGFEISASGATVLGFAFDGSVIPAGNGVLTNLEIVITDAALSACLSDVVLSDNCLLYTSPSPRDLSTSRMPSSA